MNRSNKTYTNINILLNVHKKIIQLNCNLLNINNFNLDKKPIRRCKTCPILKI